MTVRTGDWDCNRMVLVPPHVIGAVLARCLILEPSVRLKSLEEAMGDLRREAERTGYPHLAQILDWAEDNSELSKN